MKCFFVQKDHRILKSNLKPDTNNEVEFNQGKYFVREGGTFLYSDNGKDYELASFWTDGNPNPHNFKEINKGIPSKVLQALMGPRIWRMLAKGDDHPYLMGIIILTVINMILSIIMISIAYGNPLT